MLIDFDIQHEYPEYAYLASIARRAMDSNSLPYHNVSHVYNMLGVLDALVPDKSRDINLRLAIWFHDAVFVPGAGPGVNEANSVRFFLESVASSDTTGISNLQVGDLKKVESLILDTTWASHCSRQAAESEDSDLIRDLDLISLGITYPLFVKVQEAICRETTPNVTPEVLENHATFLYFWSSTRAIFRTRIFKNLYEDLAFENICRFYNRHGLGHAKPVDGSINTIA